jgi:hypothetical protein
MKEGLSDTMAREHSRGIAMETRLEKIYLFIIAALAVTAAILTAGFFKRWDATEQEIAKLMDANADLSARIEALSGTIAEHDGKIDAMNGDMENLNTLFGVTVRGSAVPPADSAATDGMAATKILDDLRNLKNASLMFYADENRFPTAADSDSLDKYLSRPFLTGVWQRYPALLARDADDSLGGRRGFIGLRLDRAVCTDGVRQKLSDYARSAGLWQIDGKIADIYAGGLDVYIVMR